MNSFQDSEKLLPLYPNFQLHPSYSKNKLPLRLAK
ncbi:unnamed protein product [Arabidopsis halleri]